MAKRDGQKKDRVKLPKHVAGVKVPKALRRQGEALIEQAQTEAGRAAIARGVATVAGVAAAAVQAAAAKRAGPLPPGTSEQAPDPASSAPPAAPTPPKPDPLVDAIGAGVEAVLGKLLTRR